MSSIARTINNETFQSKSIVHCRLKDSNKCTWDEDSEMASITSALQFIAIYQDEESEIEEPKRRMKSKFPSYWQKRAVDALERMCDFGKSVGGDSEIGRIGVRRLKIRK